MATMVNREEFLRQLQTVSYGLSTREIQEQSNAFVFLEGNVYSFNDEVCCKAPSPLGEFTGAVRAKKLLEILEKRPDEELKIQAGEGELLLIGKGGKSGIYMEAEVHLKVEDVEQCQEWKPLCEDFSDAVRIARECAGHDASQDTSMIHIHTKYLEAFDNFQFVRYKLKVGIEQPTQVKRDSLKNIVELGLTEIGETENWLHFRNSYGLVYSCRRFVDAYKDLSPVFQVEGGESLALPKSLVPALERTEVFSSESDDDIVHVELRDGKMRVTGRGASGRHSEIKKVQYHGKSCGFVISPKLLGEISKKYNEVHLTEDKLWVTGGHYKYVSLLGPVENGV